MESRSGLHNYIFFLQLGDRLPDSFIRFSEIFSLLNITLIPVQEDTLKKVSKGHNHPLIAITPDLASARKFERIRMRYLDFALQSSRFTLFHLSSFGQISIVHKIIRMKIYHYHRLPIDMNEIAGLVAMEYYKSRKQYARWPGGKRATLPPLKHS